VQQTSHVCAFVVCFLAAAFGALSHERRTTPALELLNTVRLADARASEQGFEIHAVIKLEQEKAVEAEGTYLLVWASPTRWREEFSVSDFHQIRVSGPGGVWEKREPYFLSLHMWQLMQALNFYGRLELQREKSAGKIKGRKKEGSELRCIEISRDSSPEDEFCFHKDLAQLVSEHYLPSDRRYEFTDYSQNGMTDSDSQAWVMLRIGRPAVQSHKRKGSVYEESKVCRFGCPCRDDCGSSGGAGRGGTVAGGNPES
jgi:hypothetical protein